MTETETPGSVPLTAPSGSEPVHRPPEDRVPADQRVAGLDRRTIWPGAVVLIVWASWAHAMPWIDSQIEVDNPIVAGDVINLGFGEVTFVPAVGWQLESGVLLTEGREQAAAVPASATLLSGRRVLQRQFGQLRRDARGVGRPDDRCQRQPGHLLLAKDEQGRSSIQNADGVPGEVVYLVGVDQAALIATFVFEPVDDDRWAPARIGVEIEVEAKPGSLEDLVEEFAPMIESTTYRPAGQEGELMTDTASRVDTDSVVAARRAVIDESGWGAPFRFIQPHNFTFWVMVLLFIAGASLTYQGFRSAAAAYTQSFTQGFVWFGLFAILFLWLFARLDRYSSIPAKAKVVAFLFSWLRVDVRDGGGQQRCLPVDPGQDGQPRVHAGVERRRDGALVGGDRQDVAGRVAHRARAEGHALRLRRVHHRRDLGPGVPGVRGCGVHLRIGGRQLWSSRVRHVDARHPHGPAHRPLDVVGVVRCRVDLSHRPTGRAPRRAFGVALILWAMFLHWFWDSVGALTGGATWSIGIYLPLTLVCLGSFIWIYRRTVVKERNWARALLAAEVDRGVITADELDAAVGTRKNRKRFVKSQPNRRRAKHVLEATNDLADEIANAYAVDTPEVDHARAEIARVRLRARAHMSREQSARDAVQALIPDDTILDVALDLPAWYTKSQAYGMAAGSLIGGDDFVGIGPVAGSAVGGKIFTNLKDLPPTIVIAVSETAVTRSAATRWVLSAAGTSSPRWSSSTAARCRTSCISEP